jgi:hypothetical protein
MINFIQLLRKSISGLERYPAFLLAGWLVVMLSLPLLNVVFGQQALLEGLALAVLLQVAFVLNVLYRAWGWWSMIRAAAGVVLLAWVVQAIVIRSGLPYGDLLYTSLLQPQVLGVPALIPLTWLMMLPPAWAVAKLITQVERLPDASSIRAGECVCLHRMGVQSRPVDGSLGSLAVEAGRGILWHSMAELHWLAARLCSNHVWHLAQAPARWIVRAGVRAHLVGGIHRSAHFMGFTYPSLSWVLLDGRDVDMGGNHHAVIFTDDGRN